MGEDRCDCGRSLPWIARAALGLDGEGYPTPVANEYFPAPPSPQVEGN